MKFAYHIPAILVFLILSYSATADNLSEREKIVRLCFECHSANNNNPDPTIPKLIGLGADYIIKQTLAIMAGKRSSPLMKHIIQDLSLEDLTIIAEYYSGMSAMSGTKKESSLSKKGREIYIGRSCHRCHGINADPATAYIPGAPLIKGQNKEYIIKTMKDMRIRKRPTDKLHLMQKLVLTMTDEDIEAVSEYISTLQ